MGLNLVLGTGLRVSKFLLWNGQIGKGVLHQKYKGSSWNGMGRIAW